MALNGNDHRSAPLEGHVMCCTRHPPFVACSRPVGFTVSEKDNALYVRSVLKGCVSL